MSQSTVAEKTRGARMVLPCGCVAHAEWSESPGVGAPLVDGAERGSGESGSLRRLRDVLDDLTDVLPDVLREATDHGRTTVRGAVISLLADSFALMSLIGEER